jgi:anti-sigma B factor antagonist
MSVRPEHTGPENTPNPDLGGLAPWRLLSCTIESLPCTTGEIIVLWVAGEVDLCTVPILHAALDAGLDQNPAHLVIDLTQMTFCSLRGLDLLTQTHRIATAKATGYAATSVPRHINRVWTLGWGDALPSRYHSTAAALTAIRAAQPDVQTYRPRQTVHNISGPVIGQLHAREAHQHRTRTGEHRPGKGGR